jgi:hypothetical protein
VSWFLLLSLIANADTTAIMPVTINSKDVPAKCQELNFNLCKQLEASDERCVLTPNFYFDESVNYFYSPTQLQHRLAKLHNKQEISTDNITLNLEKTQTWKMFKRQFPVR